LNVTVDVEFCNSLIITDPILRQACISAWWRHLEIQQCQRRWRHRWI